MINGMDDDSVQFSHASNNTFSSFGPMDDDASSFHSHSQLPKRHRGYFSHKAARSLPVTLESKFAVAMEDANIELAKIGSAADDDFDIDDEYRESERESVTQQSAAVAKQLLEHYTQLCEERLNELDELEGASGINPVKLSQEKNALQSEAATWRLLMMLFSDWTEQSAEPEAIDIEEVINREDKSRLWLMSHRSLFHMLCQNDKELRNQKIVAEWLQTTSKYKDLFKEGDTADWSFTRQSLNNRGHQSAGLITSLDADAPIRESKKLHNSDQSNEELLLWQVWSLIRAGKLPDAIELCRTAGQPWRAASLSGATLLHCDIPFEEYRGNPLHFLTMHTYTQLANSEKVSNTERSVYGSLCGNLNAMLLSCKSWEDYLWAYLTSSIEAKKNALLKKLIERDERDESQHEDKIYNSLQTATYSMPIVFDLLRNSENNLVRNGAVEAYHIIQCHIITSRFTELVHTLHKWIESQKSEIRINCANHMVRFATHLMLFIRDHMMTLPRHAIDTMLLQASDSSGEVVQRLAECVTECKDITILRHLQHLITSGQYGLVALFTSKMDERVHVPLYARFLEEMATHVNNAVVLQPQYHFNREVCLRLAQHADLDVNSITAYIVENRLKAQSTAEHTMLDEWLRGSNGRLMLPSATAATITAIDAEDNRVVYALGSKMTPDDDKKIQSIHWLCFDASQRLEAVTQSNYLVRRFIVENKLQAARSIIESVLPRDTADILAQKQTQLLRDIRAKVMHITTAIQRQKQQHAPVAHLSYSHIRNDIRELLAVHHALKEYTCWQLYIDAVFAHYHWKCSLAKKPIPPSEPADESQSSQTRYFAEKRLYEDKVNAWKRENGDLAHTAITSLNNVLQFEGRWLVDDADLIYTDALSNPYEDEVALEELRQEEAVAHQELITNSEGSERQSVLLQLRRACVPYLVDLLFDINAAFSNINECLSLAELVSSEEHKLYACFSLQELHQLLMKLRDCQIKIIDSRNRP